MPELSITVNHFKRLDKLEEQAKQTELRAKIERDPKNKRTLYFRASRKYENASVLANTLQLRKRALQNEAGWKLCLALSGTRV